jgi:DNA-binding response OmpR family regulator
VARARAILCRTGASERTAPASFNGDLVMDMERHEAFLGGREVRLTAIEYKLLQELMEFPGHPSHGTNCSPVCTRATRHWWSGRSKSISASCATS